MEPTGGSVLPFSQFRTVQQLTLRRRAASFCVSLRKSRQCLTWSPKVVGSKSVSFGFRALSRIGTNCKRATRPCPCGYLGHYKIPCRCTPDIVARYRGRISGPLLDRIDLRVSVPALNPDDLARGKAGESSRVVRLRVERARVRQLDRQGKVNARLEGDEAEKRALPDARALRLLRQAAASLTLSARAHHRVLRVARTIADLETRDNVTEDHVAEALHHREAYGKPV